MRSDSRHYPDEIGGDPRLLSFLDRLVEPLERTLSAKEIAEYRLQALAHLEMMAADLREFEGVSASDAVGRALREYGRPDLLAIGFLDERCKGTRPVGFARGARSATLWSFVWFGLASAIFVGIASLAAMWPGLSGLTSSLPSLGGALPIMAGYLTGRTVPTGNLAAALPAFLFLTLYAALAAALMRPFEEAARLTLGEAVLAVPLGGVSIYLTALFRRRPIRPTGRGLVA